MLSNNHVPLNVEDACLKCLQAPSTWTMDRGLRKIWQAYQMLNTQALLDYRASTDGKFKTAKALVPQCLDSCDLVTICCFFWKTWHYMDAYE